MIKCLSFLLFILLLRGECAAYSHSFKRCSQQCVWLRTVYRCSVISNIFLQLSEGWKITSSWVYQALNSLQLNSHQPCNQHMTFGSSRRQFSQIKTQHLSIWSDIYGVWFVTELWCTSIHIRLKEVRRLSKLKPQSETLDQACGARLTRRNWRTCRGTKLL